MKATTVTGQAILQETAIKIARREAASMSHWADYHHDIQDSATRYAKQHGLSQSDPQEFRRHVDDQTNKQRWEWIVAFCEKWGVPIPELGAAA